MVGEREGREKKVEQVTQKPWPWKKVKQFWEGKSTSREGGGGGQKEGREKNMGSR